MKKILPIAAVLGVGAILLNYLKRKATAGENLKFELAKVTIDTEKTKQARFLRIFYDITLNLINQENASINVRNVFLNIVINGKNIGTIEKDLNFDVPANETKSVMFKASFLTLGALLLVRDLILKGLKGNINISGYIDTDLGRVNIDFNKEIGGNI